MRELLRKTAMFLYPAAKHPVLWGLFTGGTFVMTVQLILKGQEWYAIWLAVLSSASAFMYGHTLALQAFDSAMEAYLESQEPNP